MILALIIVLVLHIGWGEPPACAGDANRDGVVNILDLSLTVAHLHQGTEPYRYGDADGDSIVTMADLDIEAANFGNVCAPTPG
ncbi:MAG: hypothetical protein IPH53_20580 [Flavobacteriales bacterium]|nr:hypothetical protein [Flavobacteriales bacterium]